MAFKKGYKHSEETKAKISATLTGRKVPEETKAKISATLTGRKKTKKEIENIRRGMDTPEYKLKASLARKGKKQSPEWIRKRMESKRRNNNMAHSKETKEKIGKAKRGTKHSEETKKKMSEISKKRYPKEMIEASLKLSILKVGTPLPKETKAKISATLTGRKMLITSGDNHWNWKGGISCEPYCDAWADKEYKESIKERDGYKCKNPDCPGKHSRLCIHHIDYDKKNCAPENLLTLCIGCNSLANFNREYWEELFKLVVSGNIF